MEEFSGCVSIVKVYHCGAPYVEVLRSFQFHHSKAIAWVILMIAQHALRLLCYHASQRLWLQYLYVSSPTEEPLQYFAFLAHMEGYQQPLRAFFYGNHEVGA